MKKLIALLLLFSSPVYALSDCADKPTCEEIGYTHNEYACDQKIAMPCPFDSSKIYCPGPICEPGYFLYSDGSCSLALKSDKTVIGIVFDKEQRLAVSVEPPARGILWANNAKDTLDENGYETIVVPDLGIRGEVIYGYYVACENDCNGRINTKKIVDFGKANNYSFPAAEYCYNFAASGKGKGNWWLPSNPELWGVYYNFDIINASLSKAQKDILPKTTYWTSRQTSAIKAEYILFSINQSMPNDKRSKWHLTLCVTRY